MLMFSKWISYETGEPKGLDDKYGNPSPYFRKAFYLERKPVKATLAMSAVAVYKAYINGEEVSNDYLSPGWVDYRRQLPVMRYDVTDRLGERNALGVVLGDGWAVGHIGSHTTFKRTSYADKLEFEAELTLEYEDGTKEVIGTDDTWKATQGAIRRSDIYMGEYVDARLDLGNFSHPDYDDSAWDNANAPWFPIGQRVCFSRNVYLREAINPPTVVKHVLEPELIRSLPGRFLYDVKQNISGVLRLVVEGKRGTKIVVQHGEILDRGELYRTNLRKAEAEDTYILAGTGEETFRPLFTFHGFQFAEVFVYGEATIKSVVAECMYTDLKATGTFSCSDPMVTKVYNNALWSQRDNFVNVPTDCPQRDERLGWTGDAQVFCKSAMYNMDCRDFFKKYLLDVRIAQMGNGMVTIVAPMPHVGFRDYSGWDVIPGWAECIAEVPYVHYLMYGDKMVIRDNLPAIKNLLDYYESVCPNHIRWVDQANAYGDWLNCNADMNKSVLATLFYAHAAWIAAKLAAVIGDFEQERYETLFNNIREAFRKTFMDENGRIPTDTQSTYLLAHNFGIITEEEAKPQLARKLKEDGHLTCGFLGIKFLLPTLCRFGMKDEAYWLMTSREYPGWCYSVRHGATTIWERWNSYTVEDGIMGGMNSFNHYSLGSCTEWMYEYCLGIQPHFEAPGFRKVTFRPYPDRTGRITNAQGHYDTDFGRIEAAWVAEGEGYSYTVTVPEAIDYDFDFPGMDVIIHTVSGETHTFRLKEQGV